jgi:hypothetical protein
MLTCPVSGTLGGWRSPRTTRSSGGRRRPSADPHRAIRHQEFTCRRIALETVLTSADLTFERRLTADRSWFAARRHRPG